MLAIYLLFWILKIFLDKEERKQAVIGLSTSLLMTILILGYCGLVKSQYGEFSISAVSYVNNFISVLDSGTYKNVNNNDNMLNRINEIIGDREDEAVLWETSNTIRNEFSIDEIKEFSKSAMTVNSDYFDYLVDKIIYTGSLNIGTTYVENIHLEEDPQNYSNSFTCIGSIILPINFTIVYILILIAIICLLYKLIKEKKIDWVMAFLTSAIFGNVFTVIVGAPFEQQRLFLPSISFVLLLIIYLIKILKNSKVKI